jgi:SAM-dependent methyltransferase
MLVFLDRIRFRVLKLLYERFFVVTVRDTSWQKPLFAALAPEANSRILNFGPASASTARTFADRFPEARFVGADPSRKAVEKAIRTIARHNTPNLTVIRAPLHGRLPFEASSFDKVVLMLSFHDRVAEDKLALAKEMLRLLRRGGTLHVADYDSPAAPGEGAILKFARYLAGPTAADSHIDGSWTEFLANAGFTGVRRRSSHSVRVGRIAIVKARKC